MFCEGGKHSNATVMSSALCPFHFLLHLPARRTYGNSAHEIVQ